MASRTEIANIALARVGGAAIVSLDSATSDDAAAIRAAWDTTRDRLLREHDWNFARKRVALVRLPTAPAFGFAYYYAMPEDFVSVVEVNGVRSGEPNMPYFEVESNGPQLVMATDEESLELVYIRRVVDAGLYPPDFAHAFGLALAIEVSVVLSASRTHYQALVEEYERFVRGRAMLADSRDSRGNRGKIGRILAGSDLVRSRRSPGSGYYTVDGDVPQW